MKKIIFCALILFLAVFKSSICFAQFPILDYYDNPRPKVVVTGEVSKDGGVAAPSDAISMFNGIDFSEWKGNPKWIIKDGTITCFPGSGYLYSKREFADFQLHVEFKFPADITGPDDMRGNSGIFLHGLYEIQILETYDTINKFHVNGYSGAIYYQHAPLVNPMHKPGEWNSFEIIFTAPSFNPDGSYRTNPRVTVLFNGILVQNNAIIYGLTAGARVEQITKGGIAIQEHGSTVTFRNIWIREL